MKLTSEEKNIVDKIAAISGNSPTVVREVFYGLLIATLMELHCDNKTMHIPYLFKLDLDFSTKPAPKSLLLTEDHKFTSAKAFREEVIRLFSDEKTEVEKHLEKLIESHISKVLDFDEDLQEDEPTN